MLIICLVFWGISFYLYWNRYKKRKVASDSAFGRTIKDEQIKLTWWQKNGGYLLFVLGFFALMFAIAGFTYYVVNFSV
ncbi:hypothetical protein LNO75_00700 [Mycoplasma sp. T363T]|uniref:Uncharacterized protein n=1 Tax=Mycoplasma bradburyae TaxID=2963128 RepID=A0AAW6HQN9_9MOLU|nr:hypothetical protein [Mycoplasma bradburyae]MDC4163101.1 hypothetical protein [Mycoplasma bradburyae]MDC4181710.1 hypothetical protein [Mycoplasma bradburyae]MDC4183636.1 hypothetical protein [Mycoplasma bradburyae]UTS70244.1 hypothetical protein NMG68_00620 [Mycoplasma bradburyae]